MPTQDDRIEQAPVLALPHAYAHARPRLEKALGAKHFHASRNDVRLTPRLSVNRLRAASTSPGLVPPAENPRAHRAHHGVVDASAACWPASEDGISPANFTGGRLPLRHPYLPLLLGDDDRRDQQHALRHHLVERRDAGQDQPVVQHANDEDPEQSADNGSLAAGQRASAEHRRRDGLSSNLQSRKSAVPIPCARRAACRRAPPSLRSACRFRSDRRAR